MAAENYNASILARTEKSERNKKVRTLRLLLPTDNRMHNYKPLTLRAPPLREMFFCEFRTRRCDGFPIVTSRFGRWLSSSQRVQHTNKHIIDALRGMVVLGRLAKTRQLRKLSFPLYLSGQTKISHQKLLSLLLLLLLQETSVTIVGRKQIVC